MIHETDIPRGFTTDPMDYSYWAESNLNAIMEMNMAKLNDRAERGVIKGSGDKR